MSAFDDKTITINGKSLNRECIKYFRAAYAMTCHKSQGSTIKGKVVVYVEGMSRNMAYTALSRGTSLDNVYYDEIVKSQDTLRSIWYRRVCVHIKTNASPEEQYDLWTRDEEDSYGEELMPGESHVGVVDTPIYKVYKKYVIHIKSRKKWCIGGRSVDECIREALAY